MNLPSAPLVILTIVLVALAFGALGAIIVSCHAHKLGLLDKPCERSSHVKVTPKGGGIGTLMALLTTAFFLRLPFWFWIPAAVVSVISLFGDRIHLSQILRLGIQFVCAISVLAGYYLVERNQAPLAWWQMALLGAFLAVYIVGTANFYNFMDGINGIAGLTGAVAFGGFGLYTHYISTNSANFMPLFSLSLAAACVGFLPFNFPKARVFMGDVGSILLGFLFACSVVVLSDSLLDFVCLNSFLFPFYADELTTMIVRIRARESLLQAHRRHIYQILVNQRKIAHWKVSLSYALILVGVGVGTMLLRPKGLQFVAGWLLLVAVVCFIIGTFVRRWEYPLVPLTSQA